MTLLDSVVFLETRKHCFRVFLSTGTINFEGNVVFGDEVLVWLTKNPSERHCKGKAEISVCASTSCVFSVMSFKIGRKGLRYLEFGMSLAPHFDMSVSKTTLSIETRSSLGDTFVVSSVVKINSISSVSSEF